MRAARDLVAKKYGTAYADRLCTTNPMAAFESRPIAEQDEPLHLYEDDPTLTRRWWQIFWKQKRNDPYH
jgi:hypothetical protein